MLPLPASRQRSSQIFDRIIYIAAHTLLRRLCWNKERDMPQTSRLPEDASKPCAQSRHGISSRCCYQCAAAPAIISRLLHAFPDGMAGRERHDTLRLREKFSAGAHAIISTSWNAAIVVPARRSWRNVEQGLHTIRQRVGRPPVVAQMLARALL